MVKGVTKQVILVDSPDRQCFEKAIFILRDDSPTLSEAELLREARELASRAGPSGKRGEKLRRFLCALLGAAIVGAAWLFRYFFG